VGPGQMDDWVDDLDAVEQSLAVLILLLMVTMLAFVFRALTRTITAVFAGEILPRVMAAWSTRGQLAIKHETERLLGLSSDDPASYSMPSQAAIPMSVFPRDDAETKPTRFGNVLAAAADHPRLAYAMNGALWWPRLTPVLPSAFQEMLSGALAPMMALLNLSIVFSALALSAIAILGLVGAQWTAAIAFLIVGFLLAWLCYRAAASQATELGSMLRVAFDLYRYEILHQLDIERPGDPSAERALWQRLTIQMLGGPVPSTAAKEASDAQADT
jgi:hypothetical protein